MNAAAAELKGRGAYPLRVAARLAHMRPLTARRWVEGYGYKHGGERRRSEGVPYLDTSTTSVDLEPEEAADGRRRPPLVLDFEQLLTLLLVKAFHERGLSLPKIKAAAAKAKELYGLENPFITRRFRSDGNKVFLELDPSGSGKDRQLIEVLSRQHEFRDLVEPSLFRDVVFVGQKAGQWWPLGREHAVLVDPNRQFGQPHIAGTGTRTDVVAQMVEAEGGGDQGEAAAADWYGLRLGEVGDALRFEEWLRNQP